MKTGQDKDFRAEVTRLYARQARLKAELAITEVEIGKLLYEHSIHPVEETTAEDERTVEQKMGKEEDGRARKEKTLPIAVYEILLDQSLPLPDIVREVMSAGYKTKSKTFSQCVRQALTSLMNVGAVKKEEKMRIYRAIRMPIGRLQEKLSQQLSLKRKRG